MVGSTVLRTFMYDTNTLDSTFSGSYTAGRLVAVQQAAFTPQGYVGGVGGSNITVPSSMQFVEMYGYTQAGLTSGKRLQVQETLHYYVNGVAQSSPQTLNMDAAYTFNNEGKMTSVNYPETWSWNGSALVSTAGPTYTYSFDAMYRPTGLKDQNNNTVVNNVTYNAANQLLTFNTETRQYNNLNQMTRLTITGSQPLDISYNFPAGTNNGKISSQLDNLSAETVTYQYDSLNRLLSASSSQSWSETYGFDAFGNLLSKAQVGGAPTLSQTVNTANNQIVGQSYDANGNQLSSPLGTLAYDAENRIASMSASGAQYAYDSRNKQVWRSILSAGNLSQQVYIYGVDGQKIGTYTFTLAMLNNSPEMTNSTTLLATFFGGKRVGTFDRLGSAKYNANLQPQSFYPYGEDRGTVEPNDSLKFATYTRDAATGLDYADQRYYASNFGRFMSPDPYKASAGPKDPGSWNRYSYTRGDPANDNDPEGLTCVAQGGFWVDNGDGRGCDQNGQPTGDLTALLNDPTFVDDVWGAFEEAEQSDPADECTVSQYIFMDCDSSQAMAAAGARGWWTAYGVGSWWAAAQLVGQAGEAVVSKIIGLARNVGPGRFTIPNGNSFVVPDFVNQATDTIYEVKNMTAPGVSAQLTAMASWAQQQGWNFTLYLNSNANVSGNFKAWAEKYGVNIQYFNWP